MFKEIFETDDLQSIKDEVYDRMDNTVAIKITDSGVVNLSANSHEEMEADIVVFGAIIEDNGNNVRTFKQRIHFDSNAKTDIMSIISKKEEELKSRLTNEE